MSERLEEIPPGEPATPRESAVAIVTRRGAEGREVLMHRRSERASFLPGNWAFPGGRLESNDSVGEGDPHARCAARELREESGLDLDPETLIPCGVRITPPFHPQRFRTQFFLAEVPSSTAIDAIPPAADECDEQRFVMPHEILAGWRRGQLETPPVLPPLLERIAALDDRPLRELALELTLVNEMEELTPRIEFVPGIWLVPQRSATLPPASHTNCYLIGGERFLIVDPGSDDPAELALLADTVQRRRAAGDRPEAIVLTHHHGDHLAGAPAIAELFRLPIRAHAATARRSPFSIGGDLSGGMQLDLGGMTIELMHTPGHADGHLVLLSRETESALTGDMLSGFSTIVIDPNGGNMRDYLRSLERLAQRELKRLFPAHGPPLAPSRIEETLAHRRERAAQIARLQAEGVQSIEELALEVYGEAVPKRLREIQIEAQLQG